MKLNSNLNIPALILIFIHILVWSTLSVHGQIRTDIGLFINPANDTLEVRLRPDANFSGIVSNVVFTIRWQAASGANLGQVLQTYPEIAYIPMMKSGPEIDSNGYRYQVFTGFGFFPMSNYGVSWTAGNEISLMRIPVLNGPSFFEIVNDDWTNQIENNGDYFVSLGGVNSTGIIYHSGAGSCRIISGLYTNRITPKSARLNWQPDTNAFRYIVRGRNLLGSTWKYLNVLNGTTSHLDVYNLRLNNTYIWQITSVCDSAGNHIGGWSNLDTFTTQCKMPDSIWTYPVARTGAVLNWFPVYGAVAYEIRGRKLGKNWVKLLVSAPDNSKTVYGLMRNTSYEWTVRTWCDSTGQLHSAFAEPDTFTTTNNMRLQGIADKRKVSSLSLNVSPNPAKRKFHIYLNSEIPQSGTLRIVNVFGKEIFRYTVDVNNYEVIHIDLNSKPSGVYIILFEGNDMVVTNKIFLI